MAVAAVRIPIGAEGTCPRCGSADATQKVSVIAHSFAEALTPRLGDAENVEVAERRPARTGGGRPAAPGSPLVCVPPMDAATIHAGLVVCCHARNADSARKAHGAITLADACRSPTYGSLARVRMMPAVLTGRLNSVVGSPSRLACPACALSAVAGGPCDA